MSWNAGHLLKSGQYEVIRLIGSGGFGMTYLAKDLNLARQVVIKRPNLSFEADRDYDKFLRRFKREGQVLARLQTSNIVRVIEFTEIEEMPCLVMDFVAGETLNECIRRRKFIPEDEAWQLFQKLASAVEALHQQGIIHCDIHPGNIIVQPNGEPMLIDFGSTKLLYPTTWTVTTTYNKDFSPYEQIVGSEKNILDPQPAWDIYSLAANMFFAVTGKKPIAAISRWFYSDGSFKSPKELKPDLSNRLNRLVLKGMALEAKDRPSSVKMWISLLDVSAQSLPQDKISSMSTEPSPKNQKSKSFLPALPKKNKSNISYLFIRKETRRVRQWVAILFLVLGYFLHGVVLGNYSLSWELSTSVSLLGALLGALGWAWGRDMNTTGAWLGALFETLFAAMILLASRSFTIAFTMAFAGTFTLIVARVWAILRNNDGTRDRPYRCLLMITLNGSLISGGFSGYLTSIGIGWGILYGLFAWSVFIAMFLGYAGSEGRLKREHGEIQVFFVYAALSSIGLVSGGILGSWLKAAGILKLP